MGENLVVVLHLHRRHMNIQRPAGGADHIVPSLAPPVCPVQDQPKQHRPRITGDGYQKAALRSGWPCIGWRLVAVGMPYCGNGVERSVCTNAEVRARNIVRDSSRNNTDRDTELFKLGAAIDQLQTAGESLQKRQSDTAVMSIRQGVGSISPTSTVQIKHLKLLSRYYASFSICFPS